MARSLAILVSLTVVAASGAEPVDYARDVKPLLKHRCFACHGGLKQEAGLRLDTRELIVNGGDSGSALDLGNAAASLLIERVTAEDEGERMPPEGEPLTEEQVALLVRWIEQGADAPAGEVAEADPRDHWAFQQPVRPAVPTVEAASAIRNPIDAFIAAEQQARGLTVLPPASKRVLLRRVYLDLIGLPPTRDELHAFLSDERPDAYARVVEELLDRPQHGERWGRHWMDVWRYSDWYGRRSVPDVLNSYAQIWRWRDWIVRSLNEDKGYDRMIVEMLAADEITPADDQNTVATGFIVRNFYRWNYNTWMKDSVEHTGKAFLGLTLNCCHCHDHKYDPITQEEYFRFRAFFEPIEIRTDRAPGEPDPGPYPKYSYGRSYKPITSGLVRIVDEKLDAETFMYAGGESRNVIEGKPAVLPGGPAVLGGFPMEITRVDLPPEAWYPGLKRFVRKEELTRATDAVVDATAALDRTLEKLASAGEDVDRSPLESAVTVAKLALTSANAALAAINQRIDADRVRYQGKAGDPDEAAQAASRGEREAAVAAARHQLAVAERALSVAQAKEPVDDAVKKEVAAAQSQVAAEKTRLAKAEAALAKDSTAYTAFSTTYPQQSTGRRTALARWIANRDNPLTARVAVNHIWNRHFGRAIVGTTENLGRNGDTPTHPQLLDWLAVELMENGWSTKHIHRLIVTSAAYRRASSARPDSSATYSASQEVDPDNVYLWRFNTSRMEAEVVRDSILHAAESLDRAIGGKEIDQKLGLTTPRRSIYFEHHGEGRMQFLDTFDAADPCDCYRRTTSVRPQQALAMANSELAVQQGRLLARRLQEQLANDTSKTDVPHAAFIQAAFEQILARQPTADELVASAMFLQKQTTLLSQTDAQPEATKDDTVPASNEPTTRARESLVQALFSHSDFITIR